MLGSSLSGAKRQISSSSKTERQKRPAQAGPSSAGSGSDSDVVDASDSDSDAEDEAAALGSDIASVRANLTEEVKMVLVVNDSLKMSKGKIAAQAGHATLACAMMLKDVNPKVRWLSTPRGPSRGIANTQLFNRWRMHGWANARLRGKGWC